MAQNPAAPQGALPCYTVEAPQEFDPEGTELGPDAQVWKTYVREADQVDEELVDGWNKSMDVILIFAALFSAISTAFVIESYKNLKPDPADVTSQTLFAISQTLAFIANGSQPANAPPSAEDTSFQASAKAICVNVLWFLSLSISVAVSLISMLAKEWCLEFMANRTGPARAQARRRQQRWDGLEWWRMKGVILMLPSLIHLSLLLFAIGLCVFLWDVHFGVAIPVIIVTTLATGAYVACTVLPFLYDFCPYGTVISRSIKQFMSTKSQTTRDEGKQDKVTANALHWMITTCETPRSVDVALQSLAAADEDLPPEMLERCNAWTLIKGRLDLRDQRAQSVGNSLERAVYERASQSHLKTRRRADGLFYGEKDETRRLEHLVLGVQSCISSLISKVKGNQRGLDGSTMILLDKCTKIGPHCIAEWGFVVSWGGDWSNEVAPEMLVEGLLPLLESHLGNETLLEADLYLALSASLAFVLCCNVFRAPTESTMNTGHVLRLIRRGWPGSYDGGSYWRNRGDNYNEQDQPYRLLHLASWMLWMLISVDYSENPESSKSSLYKSTENALDTLWTILVGVVYSDWSAVIPLDTTYLTHGMFHLVANSTRYELSTDDCRIIAFALCSFYHDFPGISLKIQSKYHARYIQDLTRSLSTVTDMDLLIIPALRCLDMLGHFSPWDIKGYVFPTPEIYVFVVKAYCLDQTHLGVSAYRKYALLGTFPFPQYSSRLVQLFADGTGIVSHYLGALSDDGDLDKTVFATAQLWLLFNMSITASNRTSPELTTLEGMLLQYPRLEGNLDKQQDVADELEARMMEMLDQHNQELGYSLRKYLYRVLEIMLQQRNAPLPERACHWLIEVPECLRGITSFANLETDWSVVYSLNLKEGEAGLTQE